MIISIEDRERERILFEAEKKQVPELFERAPMVDDDACLRSVGIEGIYGVRPIGYLKLFPQDFVVEEISREGNVSTVDVGVAEIQENAEGTTYYADLVKIGISTLEAKEQLANQLGLGEKNIGYAGIKDRLALTSQEISIRGLSNSEKMLDMHAENFFLKNIKRGKGVVANGELKGNRFTITLRLTDPITPVLKAEMQQKVEDARQDGFWNFFYLQRFGTPRLISHQLGRLLLLGDYEAVVKKFLTHIGKRELPYFATTRGEVLDKWGDWRSIKNLIEPFPYHFNLERTLINHLVEHPKDFLGALHTLPDQVRLWMYAYDSFLFNRKLSELIRQGDVPLWLPFLTSFNPNDWKPYEKFLEEDKVRLPSRSYRDFPFIRVESRKCSTLQPVDIHAATFEDRVASFSFSLPKGSYATSFLMAFFTLASGLPIVPGIYTELVDGGALTGRESFAPVFDRFKTVLDRYQTDLAGNLLEE
jgi:TruD family tRNA pseudouridine synthase